MSSTFLLHESGDHCQKTRCLEDPLVVTPGPKSEPLETLRALPLCAARDNRVVQRHQKQNVDASLEWMGLSR